METTTTSLTYHNGHQYIEFTSVINNALISIEGPFVDDADILTGERILVHQEFVNDLPVHDIYIIY